MSIRTFALAPGHASWPGSKPYLILMEELEKLRLKAFLWGQKEASGTMAKLKDSRDLLPGGGSSYLSGNVSQ